MPRNNYFEFQPTKDLNRLIREYGVACLSDNLPLAPEGMTNIKWQTDNKGNVSAYVTPSSGGGGVNPGEQLQLPFYQASGAVVSPTSITTDVTGRNLTVPSLASIGTLSSTGGLTVPSGSTAVSETGYIQTTTNSTIQGAGFSLGNAGGWTSSKSSQDNLNVSQRGIHQAGSFIVHKQGVGDTAGIYGYVQTDGGITAASDEGVVGFQSEVSENDGYYIGNVVSSTGLGDQAPEWSVATSGNNWTSDGAFMLNISKGTVAGKVSSVSQPLTLTTATGKTQSTYLNYMPTTDTTVGGSSSALPITTAVGVSNLQWDSTVSYSVGQFVSDTSNPLSYQGYISLINGNLDNPPSSSPSAWQGNTWVVGNQQVTANAPIPCTFLVNLCQVNGVAEAFAVGDHVDVAGIWLPEQSVVTAEVNHGDGTQTLTMNLRNPNEMVIVFRGGVAGQYISFDANQSFAAEQGASVRSSYYAFGSMTGTDLIYGLNVGGGLQTHILPQIGSEAATNDGGASSGFHLYPGAEVVCNPTYKSDTDTGPNGTLEQNNVLWQAGDVVENPHYPVFGGNAAWFTKQQFTPSNSAQGSIGLQLEVGGPGFGGGNTSMVRILNTSPLTNFTSNNGPIIAPSGIELLGAKRHGLYMDVAPENGTGCVWVNQPNKSTQTDVLFAVMDWVGGGNINFNVPSATWQFGNISSFGTISANILTAVSINSPSITSTGVFDVASISTGDGTFSGNISCVDITANQVTLTGAITCSAVNAATISGSTQISSALYLGTSATLVGACSFGDTSCNSLTTSGIGSFFSVVSGAITSSGNISSTGTVSAGAYTGGTLNLTSTLVANGITSPTGDFSGAVSTGSLSSSGITNSGQINSTSYAVGGTAGASGTFTTVDSKTVTVTNGIITSIA